MYESHTRVPFKKGVNLCNKNFSLKLLWWSVTSIRVVKLETYLLHFYKNILKNKTLNNLSEYSIYH